MSCGYFCLVLKLLAQKYLSNYLEGEMINKMIKKKKYFFFVFVCCFAICLLYLPMYPMSKYIYLSIYFYIIPGINTYGTLFLYRIQSFPYFS